MKLVQVSIISILVLLGCLILGGGFAGGVLLFRTYTTDTMALEIPFLDEVLLTEDIQPIYSFDLYGSAIYHEAFEHAESMELVKESAKSAIVSHHLFASKQMAELFTIIASEEVETVIVMSPNHFSVGDSAAQVSFGTWETPYGELYTSNRDIQKLVNAVDVLQVEEFAFEGEHGIGVLTPFVRKAFPSATFIPIILDESLAVEDREALGVAIADIFPDAVVVASIDMSHNLPAQVTEFHDDITLRTIASGDRCREECTDVEIDSHASLDTLLAVNRARGTSDWQLTHHGSVLDAVSSNMWRDNTSHIIGYFIEGDSSADKFASVHFVGDIMLDRGVRVKTNEYGIEYPWEEMERFLRGTDIVVGNLEGTVNEQASTYTYNPPFRFVFSPESVEVMSEYVDVVSLANNHTRDVGSAGELETRERLDGMDIPWFGSWAEPVPRYDTTIDGIDISFIGYHQFHPNETLLQEQIAASDAEGRFVIVMPHWGAEYQVTPGWSQRRLAQLMVDAGADLIIGGHPHVAQGIEIIDDVLVVYSLGNFIFDQQISATWPAITVGMTLTEENVTLHLLSVYTKGSQPTPLSELEASVLISSIANASSPELYDQIFEKTLFTFYEK